MTTKIDTNENGLGESPALPPSYFFVQWLILRLAAARESEFEELPQNRAKHVIVDLVDLPAFANQSRMRDALEAPGHQEVIIGDARHDGRVEDVGERRFFLVGRKPLKQPLPGRERLGAAP